MSNDLKPSDVLYQGVSTLPGWDRQLHRARDFNGSADQFYVGGVLSSVLLAGGEDEHPVALAGHLNDEGQGEMTVVYSTHLVRVVVVSLVRPKHEVKVSLHPLSAARNIAVSTSHVFYHGVEEGNARHKDIRVEFEIHGQTLTLERARYNLSPITGDDAILAAFKALRAAVL